MNNDLRLFVERAIEKNVPRKDIDSALKAAGYDDAERKDALNAFADIDFPLAVPRRKPYLSAREAFLYLVMFGTLYASAINVGILLFQFINRWLPDPALGYVGWRDASDSKIRMATATLIVAFPIFMWISSILHREIVAHVERRASKIRKWLTYITLFVSSCVIIGDLITIIYNFLSGELTLRFGLKAAVVGGIAALVFGYYLNDLKGEETEK
ncbi:MAG: DUF5671 domain-containing protein [bacterium]